MYILGNLLIGLATVLNSVLFILTIVIIASAIVSWVNADPYNPIVRIINQITTPIYRKIRRKIPTVFANMDFTPIILLLIIMFIQSGLIPSIMQFGAQLTHGA
tara:strand:- start:150165 stop:150473 length:309 start_codon:yes stop_codon:yes gene_type:complete